MTSHTSTPSEGALPVISAHAGPYNDDRLFDKKRYPQTTGVLA